MIQDDIYVVMCEELSNPGSIASPLYAFTDRDKAVAYARKRTADADDHNTGYQFWISTVSFYNEED
jgi:hypothetical protein